MERQSELAKFRLFFPNDYYQGDTIPVNELEPFRYADEEEIAGHNVAIAAKSYFGKCYNWLLPSFYNYMCLLFI